jgi:hypothetical protein
MITQEPKERLTPNEVCLQRFERLGREFVRLPRNSSGEANDLTADGEAHNQGFTLR